jgi:hypothetical protein
MARHEMFSKRNAVGNQTFSVEVGRTGISTIGRSEPSVGFGGL